MKNKNFTRNKFVSGLITYGAVFSFFLSLRNAKFNFENFSLGLVLLLSWLLSSVMVRKFSNREESNLRSSLIIYLESFLLMLGLLALFIYFIDQSDVSRYLILNTLLAATSIEIILVFAPQVRSIRQLEFYFPKFSLRVFVSQLSLLMFLILYLHFFVLNNSYKGFNYYLFLLSLIFFWIFVSIISHNFNRDPQKNFWSYIWQYLREYFLLGSVSIFLLFTFRFTSEIANSYLFGLLVYSGWSFVVLSFHYPKVKAMDVEVNKYRILKAPTLVDFNIDNYIPDVADDPNSGGKRRRDTFDDHNRGDVLVSTYSGLKSKLQEVYLAKFNTLFEFLDSSMELEEHELTKSIVLRSRDIYNVETIPDDSLTFFLNLHEMNDLRRINQYLIEVNKILKHGGYFVGKVEPIALRYNRFVKTYPFYLARFFYFLDFMWHRVSPKLPFFQKLYFGITDGKKRALSLAESLGRIYYCGFELVDAKVMDDFVVFIAKKNKDPRADKNPSYGPLFKMKRMGKDGKNIFVYKARTMHPYAEYLQEYVYKLGSLAEGGKFKDDFRITKWGRVFRKLWIDELPMLINWLKRDLKLVGVRPLSAHYLSLYREDLRLRRLKYKPGLLPPFYADLPKTLEEIMDSEERYLTAYEKNPIMTDIKYFFKAARNILLKGARSA